MFRFMSTVRGRVALLTVAAALIPICALLAAISIERRKVGTAVVESLDMMIRDQLAIVAEELSSQAEELRTMVTRFELNRSAAASGPARPYSQPQKPVPSQQKAQPFLQVVDGAGENPAQRPEDTIPFDNDNDRRASG